MSEINEKKIGNMFNKAFFQYIEWLCFKVLQMYIETVEYCTTKSEIYIAYKSFQLIFMTSANKKNFLIIILWL